MREQRRTVIRLVGPVRRLDQGAWGRLVLPASVDRRLVCRVGGFPPGGELRSAVLCRPWHGLPRGTTLVRGHTSDGDAAVVAVYQAA